MTEMKSRLCLLSPVVSAMSANIRIQTEDFNIANCYEHLRRHNPQAGAIVFFTGLVRDFNLQKDCAIQQLTLQHYPGMTERIIEQICLAAQQRWDIYEPMVVHRVGALKGHEHIVFVGVASAHRADAYAANEFIMDQLKTQAPFWKKEKDSQGEQWLDMKAEDKQRAQRWLTDTSK